MASDYIQIPAPGSASWKDPVTTVAALPASGNTTGDARIAKDTSVIYVWTGSAWVSDSGGGTVSSVALSAPASILSVSGSPVTTSGTLALSLATQAANKVWAGPTTGADATPTFRSLVAADIPAGSYITALTGDVTAAGPGSVLATLATVNTNVGSFGSSTSIPTFTVNGKGLITAASGNAVVAPAGTLTGTTLASNVVTSSLTTVGTIGTGVWQGTAIAIANGGTGASTTSQNFAFVGPTSGSGAPSFRALVAGDIPSLSSTYLPLAGGTLTGALINNVAGAASAPGVLISGAPFTGGSTTTTKPQFSVDSAGTSNLWSTSGTVIGGNAPSGFTGNLLDLQVNAVAKFKVGNDGQATFTNSTETVLLGMSASNRFTINNNAHAGSTFFTFATNTGYTGLGIGTFSNDWYVGITNASSDTAPLTNLIPNTGTPSILVMRNSSNTANNWSGIGFSGSTDKLTSFIYGVTTTQTAASETGDLHLGTTSAGTRADNLILKAGGQVQITTAGAGLSIKTGSNCKMGTSVLVGGTVTVSTTAVTASSIIFLSHMVAGGTLGVASVGTVTAATSFVINSSSAIDTSTIGWLIMEPS